MSGARLLASGYFFLAPDWAAAAAFFFWSALLDFASFCEFFFCVALGDLSPIYFTFSRVN